MERNDLTHLLKLVVSSLFMWRPNSVLYIFNWLNIEFENLVSVSSNKNNLTFKLLPSNEYKRKWTTRYRRLLFFI